MPDATPTRKQRSSRAFKQERLVYVAAAKQRGLTDRETLAEVLAIYADRPEALPKSYGMRTVWNDWHEVLDAWRANQQVLAGYHLTLAQEDLSLALAKVRTELRDATGHQAVASLANALRSLVHEVTELYALRTPMNIDEEVKRRLQTMLEEDGLLEDVTMEEVWEEFREVLPEVKL